MESKYLSQEVVWLTPTDEIRGLDDKDVWIKHGESEWPAHFRVGGADPQSRERGKVYVMAWQVPVPDLEFEPVEMMPTKPPHYVDISSWQRYLIQDALSLITPRSSEWLENIELRLDLPNEPESSAH